MKRQGTACQTHDKHLHPRRDTHMTDLVLCAHIQNCKNTTPMHKNMDILLICCWSVMNSVFTKTRLSQTWLMSLKGQKIKLNIPDVSHVNHSRVICIYNVRAITEIMVFKCGAKYPCITTLKYRLKYPSLYFSEIKPLGLIHIQSLVSSWAVSLNNLVLVVVIGESCFVLVTCVMKAWTWSVKLTYIWLTALSAPSNPEILTCFVLQCREAVFSGSDQLCDRAQVWIYCHVKSLPSVELTDK